MAEINVQRKGPGAWPWIIGVFALMLVGWAVIAMMDRDRDDPEAAATGRAIPPNEPAPVTTAGSATPGGCGVRDVRRSAGQFAGWCGARIRCRRHSTPDRRAESHRRERSR